MVVVVVVLTALTGGGVVVGADVPGAGGSILVVLNAVTSCKGGLLRIVDGVAPAALGSVPGTLSVWAGGLGELLDDVVDVADVAVVDGGAVDMPEAGAP